MEIYLLRHAASQANELGIVCGARDYPLSEKGRRQAKALSKTLGEIDFSRICSSPLQRAKETAAAFLAPVRMEIHDSLAELDTGEFSELTFSELWARDPRFKTPWLFPQLRYPGGENFEEMVSRIRGWFDEKRRTWTEDERVLIVGHEGTLRSIYSDLLSLSLNEYPTFAVGNCDHFYFRVTNGKILGHQHVRLEETSAQP